MDDAPQYRPWHAPRMRSSPQLRFLLWCALFSVATVSLWYFMLRKPLLDGLRLSADFALSLAGGSGADLRIAVDPNGEWSAPIPLRGGELPSWLSPYIPPGSPTPHVRALTVAVPKSTQSLLILTLPLYWAILLAAPRGAHLLRALALGTVLLALVAILSTMVTLGQAAEPYLWAPGGWVAFVLEVAAYLAVNVVPFIAPLVIALALRPKLRELVLPRGMEMESSPPEHLSGVEKKRASRGH